MAAFISVSRSQNFFLYCISDRIPKHLAEGLFEISMHCGRMGQGATAANQNLYLREEWVKCRSFICLVSPQSRESAQGEFHRNDSSCLVLRINSDGPFSIWVKRVFLHLKRVSHFPYGWKRVLWETSPSLKDQHCSFFLYFRCRAERGAQMSWGTAWQFIL